MLSLLMRVVIVLNDPDTDYLVRDLYKWDQPRGIQEIWDRLVDEKATHKQRNRLRWVLKSSSERIVQVYVPPQAQRVASMVPSQFGFD